MPSAVKGPTPIMEQEVFEVLQDTAWISEVLYEVKSGKEATVFCCRGTDRTGLDLVAVKVYREQVHRTFSNDAAYRDGEYIPEGRARRALANKSRFGRQVQFGTWVNREWGTVRRLHEAGAAIPRPLHQVEGAIVMEYLGDEQRPAKRLIDVRPPREECIRHLDRLLSNIRLWLRENCVHGDLSPYNILYWRGEVTVIDFPQACDPRFNRNAREFLCRDVMSVCDRFSRLGVCVDGEAFAERLWLDFTNNAV